MCPLFGVCWFPGSYLSGDGNVGGAFRCVAHVSGGLAVGAQGGGVKARFALEVALRTAVGMEVCAVMAGAEGTGWWLGTAQLVMTRS